MEMKKMPMVALNMLLPPSQRTPIWAFSGGIYEGLDKDSTYAILEYYCENIDCDCEELVASIVRMDASGEVEKETIAIINYGWSKLKKRCNPTLSNESPQTDLAQYLLKAYTDIVHQSVYSERVKEDYARVKQLSAKKDEMGQARTIRQETKPVGRNEPCSCGSGLKYKKCCSLHHDV